MSTVHTIRDFIDIPSLIVREIHADNVRGLVITPMNNTATSSKLSYNNSPVYLQTDWIKLNPNMVITANKYYRLNIDVPDSQGERVLTEVARQQLEKVKAAYETETVYYAVSEEKDVQVVEKHWFRKDTVKTIKQTVQALRPFTNKITEVRFDSAPYKFQFDHFLGDRTVNISIDGDYRTLEQFFESINKHEQYRITYTVNGFVYTISDGCLYGYYNRYIDRIERRPIPTDSDHSSLAVHETTLTDPTKIVG